GGSACSSGIDVGSHVISHLAPGSLHHTIRFSFSHLNTRSEVDFLLERINAML
ncbi:MAG: cysteine desulfurase, partial [Lewinella sp.]|nr:cysteine desulfurase [Lewinella sp.]